MAVRTSDPRSGLRPGIESIAACPYNLGFYRFPEQKPSQEKGEKKTKERGRKRNRVLGIISSTNSRDVILIGFRPWQISCDSVCSSKERRAKRREILEKTLFFFFSPLLARSLARALSLSPVATAFLSWLTGFAKNSRREAVEPI